MFKSSGQGFLEESIMLSDICGVYQIEVLGLITSVRDGYDLAGSINGGVDDLEPEKSEDDIFPSTGHDMEEVFLCNTFYLGEEDTGETDFSVFV